jgi:hypothetical protein
MGSGPPDADAVFPVEPPETHVGYITSATNMKVKSCRVERPAEKAL